MKNSVFFSVFISILAISFAIAVVMMEYSHTGSRLDRVTVGFLAFASAAIAGGCIIDADTKSKLRPMVANGETITVLAKYAIRKIVGRKASLSFVLAVEREDGADTRINASELADCVLIDSVEPGTKLLKRRHDYVLAPDNDSEAITET